jgi:hypothetical protein
MESAHTIKLSPSEKVTLQHLVEGELRTTELDWVALQRLKKVGPCRGAEASLGNHGRGPV